MSSQNLRAVASGAYFFFAGWFLHRDLSADTRVHGSAYQQGRQQDDERSVENFYTQMGSRKGTWIWIRCAFWPFNRVIEKWIEK